MPWLACVGQRTAMDIVQSSTMIQGLLLMHTYTKLAGSGASGTLLSPYLVCLWEYWDRSLVPGFS